MRAISAYWTNPSIDGDIVSIPVNLVENHRFVDFDVIANGKTISVMIVKTQDGRINTMARICVPCQSRSWHLKGDVLICDACGTTFDAKTGVGIKGYCVNYPKAFVLTTIEDGKIKMKLPDVIKAYQLTLQPGLP